MFYIFSLNVDARSHFNRVNGLKSQVTSLESEVDRLSDLIETQKAATADTEAKARKMVEDSGKEVKARVRTASFSS